jgi:hypothetical protein
LRRQETLGWLAGLTSFRRDPARRLPGSSPFDLLTVTVRVAPAPRRWPTCGWLRPVSPLATLTATRNLFP